MKKRIKFILVITLLCSLAFAFFNEKKLGAWYIVEKDQTQFVVIEGDKNIKELSAKTKLRLIRDDSVMKQVVLAPIKLLQLLVLHTPSGSWLMEDEQGNRGYVWSTEVKLLEK